MAEAASRLQFGVGMAGLLRPRVFLSYARRDMALADRLLQHLQAQGCTVWMDRSELLTGDDFVRGIQREIPRCDGLIFLLTKSAAASSWCLADGVLQGGAAGERSLYRAVGQATRMEFGRPRSSMRLRTSTAMATSAACASSVWKRRLSPMTRFQRPIWPSTRARRL